MDAKVKSPFTDREKGGVYLPGETFSGSAARIAELSGGGYVERPKQAAKPSAKKAG